MVSVRPAKTLDFESVYELECKCFRAPWEKQLFFEDFSKNPDSLWWVALIDRKVVGFCGLWRQYDEMHIINVCVDPQFRRLGAAKMLVAAMMTEAEAEQVKLLLLEVRVTNVAARKLYEGFGFKNMYIRKKYYQDNDEDAIVMMKER